MSGWGTSAQRRVVAAGLSGVLALLVGFGVYHVVSASFTISGSLGTRLAPGAMMPLDVQFKNDNTFSISVTNLRVALRTIDAPHADTEHGCAASDFAVEQVSAGVGDLVIGPGQASSLSQLHVPERDWPHIGLRSVASGLEGCRDASLTFAYSASRDLKIL